MDMESARITKRLVDGLETTARDSVSRSKIARLHLKWRKTPYQANRLLAIMASMYAFAGKRGLLPDKMNPARGIEKYAEKGRERFLSTEELERLGAAIRLAETQG